MNPKYKRILLKLSGEALMGTQKSGLDPTVLESYAKQVKEAGELGVSIGIVIGGGNIFRGAEGLSKGFSRVSGDYMGMLATVINGIALSEFINQSGGKAIVMTAIEMGPVARRYSKTEAETLFSQGYTIIFTFGTGNPFFTTDTASALRAVEIGADALLKGTRVDGVYTADPEKDPSAVRYESLRFDEAYSKGLKIMDLTAFTMCRENNMPIIVFDINREGNLRAVIEGSPTGTLIHI